MVIDKNENLFNTLGSAWETCAAKGYNVIFYTANHTAAFSDDEGHTFTVVNPYSMANSVGQEFCCDQVVQYIPQINKFVWILQTDAGTYLLCVASPNDIASSAGKRWTVYHLTPAMFSRPKEYKFDYPVISSGDQWLYLTFNDRNGIIARLPISLLGAGSIYAHYGVTSNFWVCSTQNTGSKGYFVTQNNSSQLRIYVWGEGQTAPLIYRDVNIATIPTEDWESLTPSGVDWLNPGSKISWKVQSVTLSRGELWVAWSGARRISGRSENSFPHPHIGIAIINIKTFKLVRQRFIWNSHHAFALPALATNLQGEVGIGFMWGGEQYYPQNGIGLLTGNEEFVASTSYNETFGGGGHYMSMRMAFPEANSFVATSDVAVKDANSPYGYWHHPRYILFRRR